MLLKVTDAAYQAAIRQRSLALPPNRFLPDSVFNPRLGDFCWMEFETILEDAFFACLRAIAVRARERQFFASVLDSSPEDNFGHSGVARFSLDDGENDYSSFFDAGYVTPTITPRSIADGFTFWGPSSQWAIFANRATELAVGAHSTTDGWPIVAGVRYVPFDSALELAAGPYRKQLPDSVRQRFEDNYRARSWPIESRREG